jgi:hypothetical protein
MQSISLSISSCSWADIVCHRDGYGELCGNWEAFFFFRLKNFQFVHQVSFLTESSEPKQMVLVTVTFTTPTSPHDGAPRARQAARNARRVRRVCKPWTMYGCARATEIQARPGPPRRVALSHQTCTSFFIHNLPLLG